MQLHGEYEGEIVLEQGTFKNGLLTHGTAYGWFQSAPDLTDESITYQWKRYIDRITSEDQRQRREYVLARIQHFVDGSCQSIEWFVPDQEGEEACIPAQDDSDYE